jgi:hypothetical protein
MPYEALLAETVHERAETGNGYTGRR